jgi:hypothetical protein
METYTYIWGDVEMCSIGKIYFGKVAGLEPASGD